MQMKILSYKKNPFPFYIFFNYLVKYSQGILIFLQCLHILIAKFATIYHSFKVTLQVFIFFFSLTYLFISQNLNYFDIILSFPKIMIPFQKFVILGELFPTYHFSFLFQEKIEPLEQELLSRFYYFSTILLPLAILVFKTFPFFQIFY